MGETMQTGKRIYSDRHGVMKRHTVSRIDRRRYICNIVSDCWHKRVSMFRWNLAYPLPPLLRLKTPFTWHHYYEHKWQLMFTLIWIWRAYITFISLLSVPTMCFTSFWESNTSTHRRLPSFLLFDANVLLLVSLKSCYATMTHYGIVTLTHCGLWRQIPGYTLYCVKAYWWRHQAQLPWLMMISH